MTEPAPNLQILLAGFAGDPVLAIKMKNPIRFPGQGVQGVPRQSFEVLNKAADFFRAHHATRVCINPRSAMPLELFFLQAAPGEHLFK